MVVRDINYLQLRKMNIDFVLNENWNENIFFKFKKEKLVDSFDLY